MSAHLLIEKLQKLLTITVEYYNVKDSELETASIYEKTFEEYMQIYNELDKIKSFIKSLDNCISCIQRQLTLRKNRLYEWELQEYKEKTENLISEYRWKIILS